MDTTLQSIGIQTANEVNFFHVMSIVSITAEGSYSRIVLSDKRRVLVGRKLGEMEACLPDYFLRIHHSHVVNLHHVLKFIKNCNSYVMLSNGEELPVSKSRRKDLLERFMIF